VEDPEISAALGEQQEPRTKVPLKIEDIIGASVMGLLCLITFVNVVVRYFTDDSFAWTEEISIFLMVVMTLVAGGAAVARDKHIRIEFFFDSGPESRKRFLSMLSAFGILVLFAAMAVLGARVTYDDIRFGDTSPGIGIPMWIYTIWLPILSVGIALRALGVLIRKGQGK
jgi:TRAP-type C4-dicarboxylate transport system permease small subunit